MGDIWPYGGPDHASLASVRQRLGVVGFRGEDVAIGAAIGMAESSLDLHVINDTPPTGDYSVGIWQINYYGFLYAERAREFGTPRDLVVRGLNAQAYACRRIFLQQGWRAWSTYSSGAYRRFLGAAGSGGGGGSGPGPPGHGILPPTEDYSPTITATTVHLQNLGSVFHDNWMVLAHLGK